MVISKVVKVDHDMHFSDKDENRDDRLSPMNQMKSPAAQYSERADKLSASQRDDIVQLIGSLYRSAARHFGCSAEPSPVGFKLRGRAAGQWRLRRGLESLHFNERLFAADPGQHMPETVAHEVAHSVVYRLHGRGRRPHGREWRAVMKTLGFEPRVTHRTSAETLARVLNHHLYRCACRSHALGPRQHRHARNGERHYHCRACGERLIWSG
jgi:SprT protein